MTRTEISRTEFACIAEAVADFYGQGYETVERSMKGRGRIMQHPSANVQVTIRPAGFLRAVAILEVVEPC